MNLAEAFGSNPDKYVLNLTEDQVFSSLSRVGRQSWRATPNGQSVIRLTTPEGSLNNPEPLFPENDTDARHYGARLRDQGLNRWHLQVDDSWVSEPAKWLEMRRVLDALWGDVGFPVVPVKIGISVHNGPLLMKDRTDVAQIFWPYRDVTRNQVSDRPYVIHPFSDTSSQSRGASSDEEWTRIHGPQVIVSATFSIDPRQSVEMVMEQVSSYMSRHEGALDVPYTPYPAVDCVGDVPTPLLSSPFVQLGGALRGLATDTSFLQKLHLRWLRSVSAACIRAAPEPLEPEEISIEGGARYRKTSRIVFHQDSSGGGICAVNGHVFRVGGRRAGDVIGVIEAERTFSVQSLLNHARDEAQAGVEREDHERQAGNLVSRLFALRAVGKVDDAG